MAVDIAQRQPPSGLGVTDRHDAWWLGPLATALGLGAFVVYGAIRGITQQYYELGVGTDLYPDHAYLLAPFYSPLIAVPAWLPSWFSPAFFILWMPGGFRVTCYYYRKAYYRAYFLDPPGCAVGEARGHSYRGETRLFLFQNLHRYLLYFALLVLVFLSIDVVYSCLWPTGSGGYEFGISVATVLMTANIVCLSLYTFSCHSMRHLVGGGIDCFSCVAFGQARFKLWSGISELNKHHMLWAWVSLCTVGFTDIYVWLVAAGRIEDLRLL